MAVLSDDYIRGFNDGINYERYNPNRINGKTTKSGCPNCGLKFNKVMGYVCGNINCPTKVTCTTNTEEFNRKWDHTDARVPSSYKFCNICGMNENRLGGCLVSNCPSHT